MKILKSLPVHLVTPYLPIITRKDSFKYPNPRGPPVPQKITTQRSDIVYGSRLLVGEPGVALMHVWAITDELSKI